MLLVGQIALRFCHVAVNGMQPLMDMRTDRRSPLHTHSHHLIHSLHHPVLKLLYFISFVPPRCASVSFSVYFKKYRIVKNRLDWLQNATKVLDVDFCKACWHMRLFFFCCIWTSTKGPAGENTWKKTTVRIWMILRVVMWLCILVFGFWIRDQRIYIMLHIK